MASSFDWRQKLGAMDRYHNIERLKQSIAVKGLSSTGHAHKAAVDAELEAYNTSKSRVAYDAACNVILAAPEDSDKLIDSPITHHTRPGITIGSYHGCHHIASGFVSQVYRCEAIALKVITETCNVEPHNPRREVNILKNYSHNSIIKLVETFLDCQSRLVLVFPYMPLTLAKVINSGSLAISLVKSCFRCLFSALAFLHTHEIIHRDIKPSNLLLAAPSGPAYLSDFGTAWHPTTSASTEPPGKKILDIGTTCYRSPEALFGNKAYGASLDMWGAGTMLAECLRTPPKELFESREADEDGNQLGLILSIFKTLGTPTKETWPEAKHFTTPPFEWYQVFPGKSWTELLPNVEEEARDLVSKLVCYESGSRLSASEALNHPFLRLKT